MSIKSLHDTYISEGSCNKEVESCYDALKNTTNKSYISLAKKDDINHAISQSNENIKNKYLRGLEGVCASLKDLFLVEGEQATGASNFLKEYISPYSATVAQKIIDAGGIIVAKDNCDMFGHGNTSTNTHFGTFHNALDASRVAGGSSGGTAVTVALGGAHFGIGSDTGGSIRQPAVYNGLVGFKPSYGAVSRYGLMSYASSLDTVGPIAQSVEDVATIMGVIGGKDEKDMTTHNYTPVSQEELESFSLAGKKVGIYTDFLEYDGLDPQVKKHMEDLQHILEENGASVITLPFFPPEVLVATYYVIAMAETASNLSRLTGISYGSKLGSKTFENVALKSRASGFSDETKKRIVIGNQILSTGEASHYYTKAKEIRKAIMEKFDKDFSTVDVILSPISPTLAPKIDDIDSSNKGYLNDMYTVGFSLGKNPTLALPTIPFGGVQLSGAYKNDNEILKFGYALQKLLP